MPLALTPRSALSSPFLLLAEGLSDSAFFRELFDIKKIQNVIVENPEEANEGKFGLEGYPDYLTGLLTRTRTGLRGLIVTRDCDSKWADAFKNICDVLTAAGYTPPKNPLDIVPPTKTPDEISLPALTVMLVPWAGGQGCLETLLLPAAYKKWPKLVPCVDQYCNCLGTGKWDINRQSKIRMRALIASAKPSNPSLSLARIWKEPRTRLPLNEPCFRTIADFVRHFCTSV